MSIEGNGDGIRRDYPSWAIYHKLRRLQPDLLDEMYKLIKAAVQSGRFDDPRGEYPNSTWLGKQILESWTRTTEWMAVCGGNRDLSRGLFGMVMWTVMYDDLAHDWHTVLTENANPGREERVYFLAASIKTGAVGV